MTHCEWIIQRKSIIMWKDVKCVCFRNWEWEGSFYKMPPEYQKKNGFNVRFSCYDIKKRGTCHEDSFVDNTFANLPLLNLQNWNEAKIAFYCKNTSYIN